MQYFNNSHPQRYFFLVLSLLSWFHRQLQTAFWFRWPAVVTCRLGRKAGHLHPFEISIPRSSDHLQTTPSDIRCRNSPSHVSVYIYALWKFNIKFMTYQTVLRFRSYVNASTDLRLKMKLKSIEQLFISSIYGWNWKDSQKVFGMR